MRTPSEYAETISLWRETMRLARFEARAAQFAIADNDPERARNHAKWSAHHAHKAQAIYAAL